MPTVCARRHNFWHAILAMALLGCVERREPPGAEASERAPLREVSIGRVQPNAPSAKSQAGHEGLGLASHQIGTIDDNLPFEEGDVKIASLAWRTWVYTDTGPKRTRYGYLRVGQIVAARGPAIKNEGCAGGWYRINPRGFVCIGKGATLDKSDPIIEQAGVRPTRGQGFPYLYALSASTPPLLYFKLPSREQMTSSEGDVTTRVARFRERVLVQGTSELGGAEPPPEYLKNGHKLIKPYGVQSPLRYVSHAGRASADSGFAIQRIFEWEDRYFGLTTEHDLIALDNTELVKPGDVRGVSLGEDEGLPVGFVFSRYAPKYIVADNGQMQQDGVFQYREGLKLTGGVRPGGFLETSEGFYVVGAVLRRIEPRTSFPSFATGTRKWIDLSIRDQTLVAYIGTRPVYAALVSTGRGGMGDPELTDATVRGTFMIHSKHVSATMDGDDDRTDSFNLRDVPFVQYFHKGYALHGTYWHDDFGKIRSHGCVNLSAVDAAWLFEWTDPEVPPHWHSVMNLERGTVVHVRP